MTIQIRDTCIYKGEWYEVDRILVTPEQFGMGSEMMHTGCYRGFYVTHELIEAGLFIRDLTLREKNGNYLPVNGVQPERTPHEATYRNVKLPVIFTGKIRLTKDLKRWSIMYWRSSACKRVREVTLHEGKVVMEENRRQRFERDLR